MIVDLVRGRNASEAAQLFSHDESGRTPSSPKLLESAGPTRAMQAPGTDVDALFVSKATADKGPNKHNRRWRPRAVGRAPRSQGITHIVIRARRALSNRMGQKTHPYGFRLGVIKTWTSSGTRTRATRVAPRRHRIKRAVKDTSTTRYIASVEVERAANKAKVIVFTARPGMVIARAARASRS